MSPFWWFLAVFSTGLLIFAIGVAVLDNPWVFVPGAFVVLAGICGILVVGITGIQRHVDRQTCRQYSYATLRPTRFATYTYWRWACLTPSSDGKWIPVDQLRQVTK